MTDIETKPLPETLPAGGLKPFFGFTALFSLVVNILVLVSPLYMLQVYDRILTSGSVDTLITLSVLAVALLLVYGVAEMARRKVIAMASDHLQTRFGPALFEINLNRADADKTLPKDLSYLSTLQAFFSNGLILPLFDLPFSPFFVLVMFLIHPLLGWVGIVGIVVLFAIAIVSELVTRQGVGQASGAERATQNFAAHLARQQGAIASMGMGRQVFENWIRRKTLAGDMSLKSANRAGAFGSLTRSIRLILQVAALGIGAWLVLQQQTSAGAIVAGSVLLGRALAPIDQSVGIWRQIIRAREAWRELNSRLKTFEANRADISPMPRPVSQLVLQGLQIGCPQALQAVLPKFSVTFSGGQAVAIVGRSGIGKTALLQTLAGVWTPVDGHVILGGRDLHKWSAQDRGRYIGYLPQAVELLPGTVAQNICRFTDAPIEAVIEVAMMTGCHEMILSLPQGYDTWVGPDQTEFRVHLSAGQIQSIGLARAVFGAPSVVFLDEPSAHLDVAGLNALKQLIATLGQAGTLILLASHDFRLIGECESVVLLSKEAIQKKSVSDFFATMAADPPRFDAPQTRARPMHAVRGGGAL